MYILCVYFLQEKFGNTKELLICLTLFDVKHTNQNNAQYKILILKLFTTQFNSDNKKIFRKIFTFLAYFLEYAIVRTSSVCLSVCLYVGRATTFHGVARLGRFMARSIAYDPRAQKTEGIFWTGPGPGGRGLKSKFRIFSYKYCILLVFKKGY
jgi:hypothetical protein